MSRRERVDQACDRFEQQWRAEQNPRIEDFLEQAERDDQQHLLHELIVVEMSLSQENGQEVDTQQYGQRFAAEVPVVESALKFYYQHFAATNPLDSTQFHRFDEESHTAVPQSLAPDEEMPEAIDRFRILRRLGRGGFGVVYLAHDTQLDRQVALKVPRVDRFDSDQALDIFVQEARSPARLDHPGIVRVYDVQRQPDLVYIVQQYIAGADLAAHLKVNRLSAQQIAELLIAVADAVGYAHEQGCWHRDLKPSNLLIDANGRPYVADFGLALHESMQRDRAGEVAGTREYMSPEQVRGEAHRLDGRSDIWSLGVILYELLTGRRPFSGETRGQLQDEILHRDPKPPRMIAPTVPRELARICLACLCKKATDRYQTTTDLIEDLRHWLVVEATEKIDALPSEVNENPSGQAAVKIVPKGLRSFDASDADFFLELLPGPRDREGLPKRVRFWKTQIEKTDPTETFPVGLMYGPSGCGKSSLVKAGLIPRLRDEVLPVYVEATADDTEVRLIKALRRSCPGLPVDDSLPGLIAHLRSGGGWQGRKVLLVIDQFEQWLHAHESLEDSQLVPALRQCDGGSVQCLVLVRDDFYASLNRFFQQLEVRIVEEHNSALVDLFDADHAHKVLTAIGRAYGKLPDLPVEPSAEQARFLQHAIQGLAEDGKVICVRLAVFTEMMKGRPWTDESLREVGGTEGVGVSFLDETFTAKTAPPSHRLHYKAIASVLEALLPEYGTDIKGQMKSYDALQKVSGYLARPTDFESLLRILDSEVRLITPTEPDELPAASTGANTGAQESDQAKYYQLTHDFLVPSLREWLTRNQRATRRGRTQLLLRELSQQWNLKPDSRRLPTLLEMLSICRWSKKSERTQAEGRMVNAAVRRSALRAAVGAVGFILIVAAAYQVDGRFKSNALFNRLLNADTSELPHIVGEFEPYRRWMQPRLQRELAARVAARPVESDGTTEREKRQALHLAVALAKLNPTQVEPVLERIPHVPLEHLHAVARVLAEHVDLVEPKLWDRFDRAVADEQDAAILSYGAVLAQIAPLGERWPRQADPIARQLGSARSSQVGQWLSLFAPVKVALAPAIVERYVAEVQPEGAHRANLLDAALEYAVDQPELWAASVEAASSSELEAILKSERPPDASAVEALTRRASAVEASSAPAPDIPADLREVQRSLEATDGFLDADAAMVPALTRAEFDRLHTALETHGYRAVSVRPFTLAATLHVASAWRRDIRHGRVRWDLQVSDIAGADQVMRDEGLVMADFARYSTPEPRWVAVWHKCELPLPETRIESEVLLEEHRRHQSEWSELGFAIERFHIHLDEAGVPRCTALWKKTASHDVATFVDWRYERGYGDLSPGSLQTDCRMVRVALTERDALAFHKYLAAALEAARDTPSQLESDTKLLTATKFLSAMGQARQALEILRDVAERRGRVPTVHEQFGILYARAGIAAGLTSAIDQYANFEKQKDGMLDFLRLRAAVLTHDVEQVATHLAKLEQLAASDEGAVELTARAHALIATVDVFAERWPLAESRARELLRQLIVERKIQVPETLIFDIDFDSLRDDAEFAALCVEMGFHQRYSASFRQVTGAESRQLYNLEPSAHRLAALTLRKAGFIPHAVSVSTRGADADQISCCSVWHRAVVPATRRVAIARRRSNLALALAKFGHPDELVRHLGNRASADLRSHVMTRTPAVVAPELFVQALRDSHSDDERQGLLLLLGGYNATEFSDVDRTYLQAQCTTLFSAPSAKVRSAAAWCGTRWKFNLAASPENPASTSESRDWYVNPAGQVMIKIDPPEKFLMGSPEWEKGRGSSENLFWSRIGRRYALAATETTEQAFRLCLRDEKVKRYLENSSVARTEQPQTGITWRQAAMFCQWLSEQDPAIPPDQYCYPDIWNADAVTITLPKDYLERTGYRLPREMEWEWAARAGSTGCRPSGDDQTLLPEFECFVPAGRDHAVGTRRPNDFGFFDMLGNVHEWCDDLPKTFTRGLDNDFRVDNVGNSHLPNLCDKCTLRGGSYKTGADELRSANRNWQVADYVSNSVGFRVARTLSAD